MKNIILYREIYPDFDKFSIDELKNKLKEFEILGVKFLFDSGLEFSFNQEKIKPKNYPGDLSFYSTSDNSLVLTIEDSFDEVTFKDPSDNLVFSIPTMENELNLINL